MKALHSAALAAAAAVAVGAPARAPGGLLRGGAARWTPVAVDGSAEDVGR